MKLPQDEESRQATMPQRSKLTNGMGYMSIALSLVFWLLVFVGTVRHQNAREQFMLGLNTWAYLWNPIWALALFLAVLATVMGSRRWALAALLSVGSCLASWMLLASVPF
jgi:hypothetical protein